MNKNLFLSTILALCTIVTMNAQIVIEAESFSKTSGPYEGFQTYQLSGASGGVAINYNQTGDYAMYELPASYQSGKYSITYYISTPTNNAGVELSVMSPSYEEAVTTAVPNNGSWDSFQQVVSTESINLINGDAYSIVVKSVGNNAAWQWNLDKIELTRVGELNFPLESINPITEAPITVKKGASMTLEVGTTPSVATNQNLVWTSSNPAIVSVPTEGTILTLGGGPTVTLPRGIVENYITGLYEGTATITATSEEGAYVAAFEVNVVDDYNFVIEAEGQASPFGSLGTPVSSPTGTALEITSNGEAYYSFIFETDQYWQNSLISNKSGEYLVEYLVKTNNANTVLTLTSKQYPEDLTPVSVSLPNTNGNYVWVAIPETINFEEGRNSESFILKVEGTDAIQCTFDQIRFTRIGKLNVPAEGLEVYGDSIFTVKPGTYTNEVVVKFTPWYTANQNVIWTSSNTAVVKIEEEGSIKTDGGTSAHEVQTGEVNNFFETVSVGTATITATSEDGAYVATFEVTVQNDYSFVIEAEGQASPFGSLGTPVSSPTGTALEITSNGEAYYSFIHITDQYWSSSLFYNKSGEYSVEYLVKTNNANTVLTLTSNQTPENLAPVSVTLPNTNGNYEWVSIPETINFEDGRNAESFTLKVEGTDAVQCTFDQIRFSKVGELNIPAEGLEVVGDPVVTLEPGYFSGEVNVKFTPWYTANQNVIWTSSNVDVVKVETEGYIKKYGGGATNEVQTGEVSNFFEAVSVGTATITATSVDGNFAASFTVNVQYSDPIIIEAESFEHTAGTYDGFQTYQLSEASSGVAINWNQTGDWATYLLPNGIESGVYKVDYFISTPTNGAQIGFAVDYGDLEMTDAVPNNGSWDSFTQLTAAQTVEIDATTAVSVQVKSVGNAGAWQWNLDYFVLSKVAELPELKSATSIDELTADENSLMAYPTNVVSDVTVEFNLATETNVSIEVIDINGLLKASIMSNTAFDAGVNTVTYNASNLTSGTYLVRLIAGDDVLITKIIK